MCLHEVCRANSFVALFFLAWDVLAQPPKLNHLLASHFAHGCIADCAKMRQDQKMRKLYLQASMEYIFCCSFLFVVVSLFLASPVTRLSLGVQKVTAFWLIFHTVALLTVQK